MSDSPNPLAALLELLRAEVIAAVREALQVNPEPPEDTSSLTTEALSARLGLHPVTIRKWARDGRIPATRIGDEWRYDLDAVRSSFPAGGDHRYRRRRTAGPMPQNSGPRVAGTTGTRGHR